MEYTAVSAGTFATLEGLDDWRFLLDAVHAHFRAGSFQDAASLLTAIAHAADAADHHPDLALRYPDHVRVSLTTHAVGELTEHDVALARRISELAAAAGASAEVPRLQALELAYDSLDADRIRPFWAALLGYEQDPHGNLVDPLRFGPTLWFQQMDEPRPERDRFHLDVTVPHELAEARVAAALDAGGTLVEDRYARSWWVLADPDGNLACVCTWQER